MSQWLHQGNCLVKALRFLVYLVDMGTSPLSTSVNEHLLPCVAFSFSWYIFLDCFIYIFRLFLLAVNIVNVLCMIVVIICLLKLSHSVTANEAFADDPFPCWGLGINSFPIQPLWKETGLSGCKWSWNPKEEEVRTMLFTIGTPPIPATIWWNGQMPTGSLGFGEEPPTLSLVTSEEISEYAMCSEA